MKSDNLVKSPIEADSGSFRIICSQELVKQI